jgi:hypothetical protein
MAVGGGRGGGGGGGRCDGGGARHGVMWERGHLRHGPAPGPADRIMVARPFLKPALDDAKRTDPRARIEAVVKAAARSV